VVVDVVVVVVDVVVVVVDVVVVVVDVVVVVESTQLDVPSSPRKSGGLGGKGQSHTSGQPFNNIQYSWFELS
jgi:hypothetical protein